MQHKTCIHNNYLYIIQKVIFGSLGLLLQNFSAVFTYEVTVLVFEYGQFKHAQREITPKLVWLRVLLLGVTLCGVVWNLIYYASAQERPYPAQLLRDTIYPDTVKQWREGCTSSECVDPVVWGGMWGEVSVLGYRDTSMYHLRPLNECSRRWSQISELEECAPLFWVPTARDTCFYHVGCAGCLADYRHTRH